MLVIATLITLIVMLYTLLMIKHFGDKNNNANSTQSDRRVIETLVMTMCTTSVMARIMVKQDLHMHVNDKSHNVTRPCATKFAPEAATTQNLVKTTNIFM